MGRPKRWYNREASLAVRVVGRDDPNESFCSIRWRHPRIDPTLWECLAYPLTDGPGLGLLFFFPPIFWVLSLPIFDLIAVLQPLKADWRLGLLVVPVMVPIIFSFSMTFGYALVFLGHMLVGSSMGENDHPIWPEWHPADIAEGIVRWIWAAVVGLSIGAAPLALYWFNCGPIDVFDCLVFAALIMLAAGFGQMALAAAMLHENIVAANPHHRRGGDRADRLGLPLAVPAGRNLAGLHLCSVSSACSTRCPGCGWKPSPCGGTGCSSCTWAWCRSA